MLNKINILVVDDDLDDHQFFKEAITGLKVPHFVTSVYNGIQALDFLLKRGAYLHREDDDPDFVVLDLNMPVLDGFQVLEQMKKIEALSKIPVYVLTTSKADLHQRKCIELGCAGFFSKPPKLEELRSVIRKMIES